MRDTENRNTVKCKTGCYSYWCASQHCGIER